MTVLVTGGTGYIGSHTCLELLEKGWDVVAVDNLSNSSPESLRRVSELTGRPLPFFPLDLRDETALGQIFGRYAFDGVIHFAGLKAVGESVAQPLEYYGNNLQSTVSLCRAMVRAGVGRVLFSSSATVYAPGSPLPLGEDAPTGGCTSPYGWTKWMIEQILRDTAAANPGWSVALLRYFNPVGAHPSGRIGEDPRGIPNNLMPYITQVAAGRRECLTIFGGDYDTPDGTCVRDYLHVVDLARGHVAAMEYLLEHTGTETFNLGTGRGYSVREMADAFERANGVRIPWRMGPRRPGDVAAIYANPAKSRSVLGWTAERTLEDMCRDSWNWQRQNPQGYET